MIFDAPTTFSEALKELERMKVLPTDLGSAELRQLDAEIRARSIFSARTTKADVLQELKDVLGKMGRGEMNIADARAALQDKYDELDYTPQQGFPGDPGFIPPAEEGELRDLSSDLRTKLVLETNSRQLANKAFKKRGETAFALYAWPCYELVRIYPREVPRGEKRVKGEIVPDPGQCWPDRWEKCGGQFYDGRMIARKDDLIWPALGDSSQFDDALDTEVPPFAFGSGYGWREVPREECIELGVIQPDDEIEAPASQRAATVETSARFDPEFLKAIRQGLDVEIEGGKLKMEAGEVEDGPLSEIGPGLFVREGKR